MALSAVVWRKREGGMLTCSNISYSMEEIGKTKKGNVQLPGLVYNMYRWDLEHRPPLNLERVTLLKLFGILLPFRSRHTFTSSNEATPS